MGIDLCKKKEQRSLFKSKIMFSLCGIIQQYHITYIANVNEKYFLIAKMNLKPFITVNKIRLKLYSLSFIMKSKTKNPALLNPFEKQVQIFSSLVEMRYKPINENGTLSLAKSKQRWLRKNKQLVNLYDPVTMALQEESKFFDPEERQLKYLANLSPEHFIMGNQNQIDMVGFGSIAHGYVDTDYFWSLSLKGPIEGISVDPKKSMFIILSQSNLIFYEYNVKSRDLPVVVNTIAVKEGVRFVRFLKDILLGIFYNNSYEVYNIENLRNINKKLEKNYPVGKNQKLLTIPPSIDYIINIFFEVEKQGMQSFQIWCLQVNFGSAQIRTKDIYHVYDVMNHKKNRLHIQNYTQDIIFVGVNHQILALKHGYLIDKVNLSSSDEREILKYLHPNIILHITKKSVEVYNFSINMNVKPQKIVLHTTDSIELKKVPEHARFLSVLKTSDNNFAIFYEDKIKKRHQTRGQITYYFELTQNITVKEKMDILFDEIEVNMDNPQFVQQKYTSAVKMGLSQKQIFLQIWNRSTKCTTDDYQYLLATKDYKIIKNEIEKKLKKQSMVLRQLIRIEESCHEINKQLLLSTTCTEQNMKDFISSHFLLKKLKVYKDIAALDRLSILDQSGFDEGNITSKQLKIDVHNYFHYKNSQIKTFLVELINDMLFNLKNNAKIIRMVIKHFKFIYRLIYKDLLQDIIVNARDNLIELLNELPQLLPFHHQDLNEEEKKQGLYGGIWGPIDEQEWEKQLYPEAIKTLYNKQNLIILLKSIWFKRYWLTSHGVPTKERKEIEQINQFNNSQKQFYFFISKLYDHFKSNKPMYYQIVQFLEEKYERYPAHLKGKAPLYENLYIYYFNQEQQNGDKIPFSDFLEWNDQNLFKYFFDHQKVKKNSLLKQIKPIYEQSDANGAHLFNVGLFSYFYSDISEVSDLKFILNRINNEKEEFHQKNKGIYEVLIRSVQFKIKIGTGKDIPMDQVMVYIKNIQLSEKDQIVGQLLIMDKIQSEIALLQAIKINMSIKEIMDNYETVIFQILKYKVQERGITEIQDYNKFLMESLEVLKQTLLLKEKIYADSQSNYMLLVYLSMVLEKQSMIELVSRFVDEEQLQNTFEVSIVDIQNLVLYMYKWSFSQSAKYVDNAQYLKKLLDLLAVGNQSRCYLENDLEIGLLLSSEQQPFEYPLNKKSNYPSAKIIRETFKANNSQFLLSFNLDRFHQYLMALQGCIFGQAINPLSISLHKLYELMIVELLEKRKFQQVLEYIKKILELQTPVNNSGILYVALYIFKTVKEFNEQSRKNIFKLLAINFHQPREMLKVLDFAINTRLTGLQQTKYLRQTYEKQSSKGNFNPENPILNSEFSSHYNSPNSKKVIEAYRLFLKGKSPQFDREVEYDIIFTFLCNAPLLLIKFIQIEKDHLNLKSLYTFLMMTVNRPIFNKLHSYEVLKRIFSSLTMISKELQNTEELIISFDTKSTEQQYNVIKITKLNDYEQKVYKIAKLLQKIKKKISKSKIKQATKQKGLLRLKTALTNPSHIFQDQIQITEEEANVDLPADHTHLFKTKIKVGKIKFKQFMEKQAYFYRHVALPQFLEKKISGKVQQQISLSLVRKQSAPLVLKGLQKNMSEKKEVEYLTGKQRALEHLYSHKVVSGSEMADEDLNRKEDEEFLDSFLPKPEGDSSRVSLASLKQQNQNYPIKKSKSKEKQPSIKDKQSEKMLDVLDKEIIEEPTPQETQLLSVQVKIEEPASQIQKYQHLREVLVNSYNETKIPKFDITALEVELKEVDSNNGSRQEFLKHFLEYLYKQPTSNLVLNLKLMEQIGRKHHETSVNIFFLQAYQRTFNTHQKLGLEMNIVQFLPLSGIYIKSKDIFDLFLEIQPLLTPLITDQNVFKMSKLIALGFRKSVVEQQILCSYLKMILQKYVVSSAQDQEEEMEKIRNIMQKLPLQVLVDKAEDLFNSLASGELKTKIFEMYMEFLKNRGYGSSAREIRAKIK